LDVAFRLERDEHTELAKPVAHLVVNIGGDAALAYGQLHRPPETQILADRADGIAYRIGNRLAGTGISGRGDGGRRAVGRERRPGNVAYDLLERIVAGNEVGFRIHLYDNGARRVGRDADEALGRGTPGLLVGLGYALGAKPVDGRLDIAIGFDQRHLAIHHARAA